MSKKKHRSALSPMILEQATRTAQVQAEHDAMILDALAGGVEKSSKEIARTMPFGLQRVTRRMRVLVNQGKAHISRKWGSACFYRAGASGQVAPPVAERILAALAEGPASAQQLADKLNLSRPHVADTINKKLRQPGNKQVYVRQFIKAGHAQKQRIKLFALGNRPDANRPARTPLGVSQRRYRDKRKKDDEMFIRHHAKEIARRIKPKADPFMAQFAGLFGERRAA